MRKYLYECYEKRGLVRNRNLERMGLFCSALADMIVCWMFRETSLAIPDDLVLDASRVFVTLLRVYVNRVSTPETLMCRKRIVARRENNRRF